MVTDRARSGRPSHFDKDLLNKLDEALSKSPQDYGIPRAKWDGVVFVEYLKKAYHIEVHVRHGQRLIRKLGYSLKRPTYRFVQARKEGVEKFRETLKKVRMALKSKGNRGIFFEDETGFSLHPKLGRIWAKKGSRPFVYTRSQHQKWLNIFGWVDLIRGSHGIMQ
jgi:hypothetical protein